MSLRALAGMSFLSRGKERRRGKARYLARTLVEEMLRFLVEVVSVPQGIW